MKRKLAALAVCTLLLSGCADGAEQIWLSHPRLSDEAQNDEERQYLGVGESPSIMLPLTSAQVVESMRVCWNLGNSLDACRSDLDLDGRVDMLPAHGMDYDETLYGNPQVSRELFKALTDSGVNAVRIPVTWRSHTDEFGNIDAEWLNRVQQVVDQAYNCGLYVIINVQHDGAADKRMGAWLRGAQDVASIAAVVRYRTIWQQIAERFENYNERLIFESMNEVMFDKLSEDRAFSLYNRLSQEFVNVIRQSGGNNPQRHIVIAGYGADVEQTLDSRFVMPDDTAGSSIVSVHYRTPRAFCGTGGPQEWGSPEEQIEMDGLLSRLFKRFSAEGVPVIISEYGVADGADEDSMVFFCESLAHGCKELGMAAFLWDGGELFDRENLEWRSSALISALVQATDGSEYIPVKFGETTQETFPEESQG